jgi:hypothetical protein
MIQATAFSFFHPPQGSARLIDEVSGLYHVRTALITAKPFKVA